MYIYIYICIYILRVIYIYIYTYIYIYIYIYNMYNSYKFVLNIKYIDDVSVMHFVATICL